MKRITLILFAIVSVCIYSLAEDKETGNLKSTKHDTIDLELIAKHIPDTFYLDMNNSVDVSLNLVGGSPVTTNIFLSASLAPTETGKNNVQIYNKLHSYMNLGASTDFNMAVKPQYFIEGEYYVLITYNLYTTAVSDTFLDNNHISKKIFLKQSANASSSHHSLHVYPSDTVYNDQVIRAKDTLQFYHGNPDGGSFELEYRITRGLDASTFPYEKIYTHSFDAGPNNDMVTVDFEAELPSDMATGPLYLGAFSTTHDKYISYRELHGMNNDKDIDISSLSLLSNNYSVNGSIMLTYTIHNPYATELEWNKITAYISNDDVFNPTTDPSIGYCKGKIAPPNTDSTFTQGIAIENAEPGVYYLFLVIEPPYGTIDKDLSNNMKMFRITLDDEEVDWDLYAADIPDTLTIGNDFEASLYIRHTTPDFIGNSMYYYMYYSEDNVLDVFDTRLGVDGLYGQLETDYNYPAQEYIAPIKGNAYAKTSGKGYVIFYIKQFRSYGVIPSEKDYDNNTLVKQVYFKESETNISLDTATIETNNLTNKDRYDIDVRLTNHGVNPASAISIYTYISTDSVYSEDDNYLNYGYLSSIEPGTSTKTIRIKPPNFLKDSTYYILMVLDPFNKLPETNEDDNVISMKINYSNIDGYTGKPDLKILPYYETNVLDIPFYTIESINKRYIPELSIKVTNSGDVDLNNHTYYTYYISKDTVFDKNDYKSRVQHTFGSLNVGDTIVVNSGASFLSDIYSPGTYHLFFVLDHEQKTPEKDEGNNVLGPITVKYQKNNAALYDTEIIDFQTSHTKVQAGDTLNLSVEIKNTGSLKIGKVQTVRVYLDADTSMASARYELGALHSGASLGPDHTISISGTATMDLNVPPGEYFIYTVREPSMYYPEYSTANETLIKKIEVIDTIGITKPNIDIIELEATPMEVYPLDTIDIKALITNNGGIDIQQFEQRGNLYLSDDDRVDFLDIKKAKYNWSDGINKGDTIKRNTSFIIPKHASGTWYVIISYDFRGELDETDETDNFVMVPITIKEVNVQPPVIKISEFVLCGSGQIFVETAPLDENEEYVWDYDKLYSTINTTDTLINFNINNPAERIHVHVDSAGFKSETIEIDVLMAPFIYLTPLALYDKLTFTDIATEYNYKWYKDSVLLDGEGSHELYHRDSYGEGEYYVEYSANNCFSSTYFNTIVFPQPIGAHDLEKCGPGLIELTADSLEKYENYQWYSKNMEYLGSGSIYHPLEININKTDSFYVAVDSMNGISEPTPFKITLLYAPSDSLVLSDNFISIADTSTNINIQWMIDSTVIDSLTGKRQIPVSLRNEGSISASLTTPDGCQTTTIELEKIIQGNISLYESTGISIYPNPVTNELFIRFSATIHTVTLYDMTGKKVKHKDVDARDVSFHVLELTQGLYLLRIQGNVGSVKTFKIIKGHP